MTTITSRVVRLARQRGLTVLTHRQWGSVERRTYAQRRTDTRRGRWGAFTLKADTVWQHITVTPPPPAAGGLKAFRESCQLVERIGKDRFGSGVSYNFLVCPTTGRIAVGQPLDAKGTHTVNDKGVPGFSYDQNMRGRAIAVLGDERTVLKPVAAKAIAGLLASMVEAGAITPGFDYEPHSLVAHKDCPCQSTRGFMPSIRQRVEWLIRRSIK